MCLAISHGIDFGTEPGCIDTRGIAKQGNDSVRGNESMTQKRAQLADRYSIAGMRNVSPRSRLRMTSPLSLRSSR